jgi:hypothetical protein
MLNRLRGIGAALVAIGLGLVVIGYLTTRPYVARVWHVGWTPSHAIRRTAPPATRFATREDCIEAMLRFEQTADVDGARCVSEIALLWGG